MAKKATVNQELTEGVSAPKERKLKLIDESLNFHDFESEPVLECTFDRTVLLGKDKKNGDDVNAHVITDIKTGERKYLSTSYGINKVIAELKAWYPTNYKEKEIFIQFLEKTIVDGKPFNRFKTGIFE